MCTLFFYKNIVFPAEDEYSNFSADSGMKIFLWIIGLDYSVLYLCFRVASLDKGRILNGLF